MTEVYAYQNDDGTYAVEIRDYSKTTKTIKGRTCEDITESKANIPRAEIQIIPLSENSNDETFIVTV